MYTHGYDPHGMCMEPSLCGLTPAQEALVDALPGDRKEYPWSFPDAFGIADEEGDLLAKFIGVDKFIGIGVDFYMSAWDTSKVTDMSFMLRGCGAFNSSVAFDTSAVTSMEGMFMHAGSFNHPSIRTWDTGPCARRTPATVHPRCGTTVIRFLSLSPHR